MRAAVFSTKPYDRKFLEAANKPGRHELVYFEPRLTPATDARPAEMFEHRPHISAMVGWLYTGVSEDPDRRFREHQTGGSRFTKGRKAIRLLWSEKHPSRSDAENRERQIKGWTRAKKFALANGDIAKPKRL